MASQQYKTSGNEEYIIVGNDALLKCNIPSFVSDFVSVMSWEDSEGGVFFADHKYGKSIDASKSILNIQICCFKYCISFKLFYFVYEAEFIKLFNSDNKSRKLMELGREEEAHLTPLPQLALPLSTGSPKHHVILT